MKFYYSAFNSLAIGIAVALSAFSLQPMLDSPMRWILVAIMVGATAGVGALGALAEIPRLGTLLIQLFTLTGSIIGIGLYLAAPDPNLGWLDRLRTLGSDGIVVIQENSAPVPHTSGVVFLVLIALALVMLITELLVNGLEQPAWSIAPLAVMFCIGAIALPDELGVTYLITTLLGYALVLLAATGFHNHRTVSWRDRVGFATARMFAAVVLVALALAATIMITPTIPMGPKRPWLGTDSGSPIELSDPTVALNENLTRPEEQQVLRYTTSTGKPTYLRTVALTRLTTDGAVLTPMRLSTSDLAGASQQPGETIQVDVTMDYPSEFLPVPFAVDSFSADGQWAFDRQTMSIIATGQERANQTYGLSYQVESVTPNPTQEQLAAADAAFDPAGPETSEVPDGIDPAVTELTRQITKDATTDGQRAQAIQNFLRSDEFEYSTAAPNSTGQDAISSFLLVDRRGYCIHFAASMMTMARIVGIPSRMAIGFNNGTADGDGFVVTTHNMHAWPELYFEDFGWVPFEPTPSVAGPPAWTDPDEASTADPSPSPSPSPSSSASPNAPTPEPSPSTGQPLDPNQGVTLDTPGEATASTALSRALPWLATVVVLALVAVAPLGIRSAQRAWRMKSGLDAAEAAERSWAEAVASLRDYRISVPQGSPGVVSSQLAAELSPAISDPLDTIAESTQRARFARDGAPSTQLDEAVAAVRSGLSREFADRRKMALLFPASVFSTS